MALNPEEIDEMDSEAMALRAEAALRYFLLFMGSPAKEGRGGGGIENFFLV